MNLVLVIFCKLCCRSIARVVASLCFCFPMFLYVFLEKLCWKMLVAWCGFDPWSEDYPRCCIEESCPWCTARWQTYCRSRCRHYERLAYSIWWLLDSLVHHALRLRTRTSKTFLKHHEAYEMFQELKLVFQTHARVKRYETSDKYFS